MVLKYEKKKLSHFIIAKSTQTSHDAFSDRNCLNPLLSFDLFPKQRQEKYERLLECSSRIHATKMDGHSFQVNGARDFSRLVPPAPSPAAWTGRDK